MEEALARIMQTIDGFMASKQLYAAERLGLFRALADGPLPLEVLAEVTGTDADRLRIVADAMVALDLVERTADGYANTDAAQAFLSGEGPADLSPAIRYRDRLSYRMWDQLPEAIADGDPEPPEMTSEDWELFSEAMVAFTGGLARQVIEVYDWSRHDRVLDIGGGEGHWLTQILQAHPGLDGTLLETPEVAEQARRAIPEDLADRIEVVEGDALDDPIPTGHDAVLLSNVIHQWSSETNRELLGRVRKAVEPGSRVLLVDTWTDETGTEPVSAALLSAEFFLFTGGTGRSYRVDEGRDWLEATRWRVVDDIDLDGPGALLLGEAD